MSETPDARATKIAPTHWLVYKVDVLVHVRAYCAVKMLIANQKVTLLGVGVALDLLKMKMANVFHNVTTIFVAKELFAL